MNAPATIAEEINHYPATDSSDPVAGAWPGDGVVVDRCKRRAAIRRAIQAPLAHGLRPASYELGEVTDPRRRVEWP